MNKFLGDRAGGAMVAAFNSILKATGSIPRPTILI